MLAKQIKNLRVKAGMSQLQLAEKLSVGPSTVGMYEQGRRTPSVDMIILLAKAFGVSIDYLLIGAEISNSAMDEKAAGSQHDCCRRTCCPNNCHNNCMGRCSTQKGWK